MPLSRWKLPAQGFILSKTVFYNNILASESNPHPDDRAYTRAAHFRFVFLFLNPVQCGLSQQLRILLLIPGGLKPGSCRSIGCSWISNRPSPDSRLERTR